MRYRVNFRKRFDVEGTEHHPLANLSWPEGMFLEVFVVERADGRMDENDDFLSLATEAWEFNIAPGRDEEFVFALKNNDAALSYELLG